MTRLRAGLRVQWTGSTKCWDEGWDKWTSGSTNSTAYGVRDARDCFGYPRSLQIQCSSDVNDCFDVPDGLQ